ncbi:hypothetical protein [Aneurinibacillus migulanus]|nr:hypothetical protein [Aneurinibacillus migulanus]MED0894698.1 hypothetical protein [Aneurinibacillus migulanus]MED1615186.1 hypothetical protein [Aneurinibacillus migulanus]
MARSLASVMKVGQKWNNGSCRETPPLLEQVAPALPQGSSSLLVERGCH